jgi:hypothetical protein
MAALYAKAADFAKVEIRAILKTKKGEAEAPP